MLLVRITALLAVVFPVSASAQVDPAIAFGARENIESIALSPDGSRIAYVIPREGQGSRLYTVEVGATQPRGVINVDGERQRLGGCTWVSNSRLVCTIFGVTDSPGFLVSASRLIALDADGSNVRVLGQRDTGDQVGGRGWGGNVIDWLAGQENQVLMEQLFIPEGRAGTLLARTQQGVGVVQVDTTNLRTRTIEDPHLNGYRYLTDGRGRVRVMGVWQERGATGQASNVVTHFYRTAGSDEWVRLGDYNSLTRRGPWPVAIDAERNALYLEERGEEGRNNIYRMALDGSGQRDMTVANRSVDIDGLVRIGRRGRVIGATYATERRRMVYFDQELERVTQQLARALPGQPLVNLIGASDDESKLLIWAGSDNDPGTYYVLDRATRNLARVMRSRPELDGMTLAAVRPITYPAADGTQIPGYLTLPPGVESPRGLPAIVMPHGGPEARDEWGFDWLAQFFANRGFAVLQPNFRGSAGYGDDWFQINGFQSWRTAIGDVNDAGRWMVGEGIADPAKLAIVGWSYGGYAALQSGIVDPGLFRAVVAIAPATDLQEARDEWLGWSNSANMRDYFGMGPHIAEGSPARHAAQLRAPVLMFHGEMDRNVRVRQSRLMRDRLRDAGKQVELIEFPALDHQLQDSAVRAQVLRRSDTFLRQALGIQ
jgi:dipeptidyl aminopeptidase/acylaminoacyl peptidase